MNVLKTISSRSLLIKVFGALLTTILVVGLALAFFLHTTPHAFAAALQGTTCVQAPSAAHCNNQDPEVQGCATDAQTLAQTDVKENDFVIGSVERRFSEKCHSWWGRVFDNRLDSHANMFITVNGTTLSASPTFVSRTYRILYSFMIFDANQNQPPAITGVLGIDGITPAASATLDPIIIPMQRQ